MPEVGEKAPRSTPVRMLLPHEILHCLAESSSPFLFDSLMLGHLDDETRVSFWKHLASLPPWNNHPALNDNDIPMEKLVGMTLHADGAAFHREDEHFVYSISSLFGSFTGFNKDVLLTKIPLAIIPERQMKSHRVSMLCESVLVIPHMFCSRWLFICSPNT